MTLQNAFEIVVVIFTVANLAAMGLELNVREAVKAYLDPRFVVLTLVWGWVAGPAIAYLLITVIPLAEGHAAGLLLVSLAPAAPFFPLVTTG